LTLSLRHPLCVYASWMYKRFPPPFTLPPPQSPFLVTSDPILIKNTNNLRLPAVDESGRQLVSCHVMSCHVMPRLLSLLPSPLPFPLPLMLPVATSSAPLDSIRFDSISFELFLSFLLFIFSLLWTVAGTGIVCSGTERDQRS
jgi:hypothetical protein